VQEKEKVLLSEIITRVNDLFEGDLTDDDRLIYVNNVLKGKLRWGTSNVCSGNKVLIYLTFLIQPNIGWGTRIRT
jgi:hypothetical protein